MADLTTQLQAAAGAAGGAATDPNFNQTVLLLHGDGTNGAQNNTFLDSSTNNFTITRNGNTTQGTFSPFSLPNGQWSNYFDGSGDYLSVADNAALEIGASSFCIEMWIYPEVLPANNSYRNLLGKWASNEYSYTFAIGNVSGTIQLSFFYTTNGSTSVDLSQSAAIVANAWNHVCVTRDSTTVRLFLNGVQQGSNQTANATFYNGTAALEIGRHGDNINNYKGYISNSRLVIGSAVYTSNFTPSTSPLTAISNTSLLTCQSNRFVDNSSNAFAITVNGNTSVQPFSPFLPTAAYSPSVNGGSGYFDGSGDFLAITDSSAFTFAGDFSISFWLYRTATSGSSIMILDARPSGSATGYGIGILSNNKLQLFQSGSSILESTTALSLNQWYYAQIVKSGATTTMYINGVSEASDGSFSPESSTGIHIGQKRYTASGYVDYPGYLSGFSIVNGTAISSSIPTSPPTNITNTSLLCNFTNAGIFDNTGKNNLETVGDAQIDTTTKKYGTGSIEFDGTGDALVGPANPNMAFGTGDFTVEGWFYQTADNVYPSAFEVGNHLNNTGIVFITKENGNAKIYSGGFFGSKATTLNAWNHIAWVRASGVLTVYVNGVGDGGTAFTNNLTDSAWTVIGSTKSTTQANYLYTGFIDDLRITKGVARYTTTFTPPTAAFPNL
jgi:hypothetical protein